MRRSVVALWASILVWTSLTPVLPASAAVAASQRSEEGRNCRRSGTGRAIGNVVGAIGGALIGRAIDGGRNRVTGTIVGGLIGTLIGGELGDALDRCEQEKLQTATIDAANSPETGDRARREWRSDSRPDTWGTVTPGARVTRRDGRECRTISRISYIEGEERRGSSDVCRRPPDTAWT